MPDIGQTLREARMRERVDITDVERETKIRAKYLRALENEEWDLLPGPAYTRSFLRAYAEALGLDGRLLVEEYKMRHDRVADGDLQPIRPPSRREVRRAAPRPIPRGALVGAVVVALVGLLWVLGQGADEEGPEQANRIAPPATATQPETAGRAASGSGERSDRSGAAEERRGPRRVRLQLEPDSEVWVCLVADGRRRIGGRTISERTRTFRARSFRVTLGNGEVTMRVNGKRRAVPATSEPIGYLVTANGRKRLPAAEQPTCS